MRNRAPVVGVLVALLLGVAFYFALYQPRNDDLDEVREETAQLESQRSSLQNELRRLEDIAAREMEFRASLARLEEYIPSGIAQSSLIRQLQLAADQSGVVITLVSFAEPQAVPESSPTGVPQTVLGSIAASVTVDGGYFQIVDFMRRIEVDVNRAILVEQVSVVEGQLGFPQLSTTWNGQLFAVVPDTTVTTPPDVEGEAGDEADPEADDAEESEDDEPTINPGDV
jgi:Tfp pilus assembly protein PilO